MYKSASQFIKLYNKKNGVASVAFTVPRKREVQTIFLPFLPVFIFFIFIFCKSFVFIVYLTLKMSHKCYINENICDYYFRSFFDSRYLRFYVDSCFLFCKWTHRQRRTMLNGFCLKSLNKSDIFLMLAF